MSDLAARTTEVAPVREAGGRLADDLRAVRVVWRRELIRFLRNRPRMVTALVQPILFLLVLGSGLARMMPNAGAGIDFRTFIFPGVLAMAVLFTSIFSAVSIVWDREFGFLREMLVAPVRRSALVIGKCLGGATVATIQGTIMLLLAGLVHVPYSPALLVILLLEMALAALAAHGGRHTDRRAHQPHRVVPGHHPAAGAADVLPVGRAVPAVRAAAVADRAHAGGPPQLCGRPNAARGVRPHLGATGPEPAARPWHLLGWLAPADLGRAGPGRRPRPGRPRAGRPPLLPHGVGRQRRIRGALAPGACGILDPGSGVPLQVGEGRWLDVVAAIAAAGEAGRDAAGAGAGPADLAGGGGGVRR